MRIFSKIKIITLVLVTVSIVYSNDKKPLTLEDIYDSDKFRSKTIENIEWQPVCGSAACVKGCLYRLLDGGKPGFALHGRR